MAVLYVPAHADTYWAGTLFSGETVDFLYTGGTPTEIYGSISTGPWSPPSDSNAACDQDCNNITFYQMQATVIVAGGASMYPPLIITSSNCDDADSCTFLEPPSSNSPNSSGLVIGPIISLTAEIYASCPFFDPVGDYAQSSCAGFSPPTYINVSIDITGTGDLTETPVPDALPLFATGLGVMSLLVGAGSGRPRPEA